MKEPLSGRLFFLRIPPHPRQPKQPLLDPAVLKERFMPRSVIRFLLLATVPSIFGLLLMAALGLPLGPALLFLVLTMPLLLGFGVFRSGLARKLLLGLLYASVAGSALFLVVGIATAIDGDAFRGGTMAATRVLGIVLAIAQIHYLTEEDTLRWTR